MVANVWRQMGGPPNGGSDACSCAALGAHRRFPHSFVDLSDVGCSCPSLSPCRSRASPMRGIGSCLTHPLVRDRRAGVRLASAQQGGNSPIRASVSELFADRVPGPSCVRHIRHAEVDMVNNIDPFCFRDPGPCSGRVSPCPLAGWGERRQGPHREQEPETWTRACEAAPQALLRCGGNHHLTGVRGMAAPLDRASIGNIHAPTGRGLALFQERLEFIATAVPPVVGRAAGSRGMPWDSETSPSGATKPALTT